MDDTFDTSVEGLGVGFDIARMEGLVDDDDDDGGVGGGGSSPEEAAEAAECASKMLQCPFCRAAACTLRLREAVGTREVSRDEFAAIASRPSDSGVGASARWTSGGESGERQEQALPHCCGRDGLCSKRFDKGVLYQCAHCPDMRLCERCFHAFDHAHHSFVRVNAAEEGAAAAAAAPASTDEQDNAASPSPTPSPRRRQNPEVHDERLGRLLARMPPQHLLPHLRRAHAPQHGKSRARCTLCACSVLRTPAAMAEHMARVHHMVDDEGATTEQRRSCRHPVKLLKGSVGGGSERVGDSCMIYAEASTQRVEISKRPTPQPQQAQPQAGGAALPDAASLLPGGFDAFPKHPQALHPSHHPQHYPLQMAMAGDQGAAALCVVCCLPLGGAGDLCTHSCAHSCHAVCSSLDRRLPCPVCFSYAPEHALARVAPPCASRIACGDAPASFAGF